MKLRTALPLALLPLLPLSGAAAQLRLPNVLSDHAVLQRDRPIHLWGWSTPNASLELRFHAQTLSTVANAAGQWSVYLQPEPAGGPYSLVIHGDGPSAAALTLTDLLVGDVWLASGQSNMEFPLAGFPGAPLKNQAAEIAASTQPRIRLLRLPHRSSDTPLNDQPSRWTECTPDTAKSFSAVAYFFARDLTGRDRVPIGLIDSSWGGTPAESWISLYSYGDNPALTPAWGSWARFAGAQTDLEATVRQEQAEDAAATAAGKPLPRHPWHPDPASWQPAGLYNGMIAPLTPLSLRGFLWYQGETNSAPDRAPHYGTLLAALIGDWRARFAQGTLPFLYAQISSFHSPAENWALVRDGQRRVLDVAGTAMAVTLDVGDAGNVHPPDKQTVGSRLALAARHTVFGQDVASSGPLFRQATPECTAAGGCSIRVWFSHAEGLHSTANQPLGSFEIAGPDHQFHPAEARIDGETVVVSSPGTVAPAFVRFGWTDVVTSNLYNRAELPASTFTSEQEFAPTP